MSFVEGEITVEFGGTVGPAGPAGNAIPIAAGTVLANPTGSLANPVGVDAAGMRTLLSAVGYSTYSEFLSTTSTVIEISSGTYTVPSDSTVIADVRGLTRHWVGGVFVKDNTATIDGGCVIANTAGDKYVRQWDKTNAVPEFYRLGVDSIASDTDAISRALSQLNNGGTVHLQREKIYIGETVAIGKGCTITGGTIKRAQLVRTTLAANASVAATSITVTSATGFRVGMYIQIASGTAYADLATNDSTNFSITNIVGNVITLNQAVQVAKSSGASVFQIADQLNYSGAINANIDCNVYLDNVTFDGNESQNAISRAWTVNNLGVFSSRLQNFRVNGCLITNQPSECFTIATRAWFTDCYFNNVWGSCIHGSADNAADYEPGGIWINSCYFENVCRSTAAENGHSTELGVYTQSQNTQHVGFDDCVLEDTNNGYIVSAVSNLLSILRCRAKDCKGIAFDANRTTAIEGPIVVDNQFQDCGNLTIGGAGDVPTNIGVRITGNVFVNTAIRAVGLVDSLIGHNTFRFNSTYQTNRTSGYWHSLGVDTALLVGYECDVIDNSIENESTASASLEFGVYLYGFAANPLALRCDENRIVGFKTSVKTLDNTPISPWRNSISRNQITIPVIAGNRFGIECTLSGTEITDNQIYSASSASVVGIRAVGVDTDTTPTLIAGQIKNNKVVGCVTWLRTSWFDSIIDGNIYDGAYDWLSGSTRQRHGINQKIDTISGTRLLTIGLGNGSLINGVLTMNSTGGGSLATPVVAGMKLYSGDGAYAIGEVLARSQTSDLVQSRIALRAASNVVTPVLNDDLVIDGVRGDVTIRGSVGVGSIADGSAPNSTIYYSTTQSKLVYKNSAGTVNVLY